MEFSTKELKELRPLFIEAIAKLTRGWCKGAYALDSRRITTSCNSLTARAWDLSGVLRSVCDIDQPYNPLIEQCVKSYKLAIIIYNKLKKKEDVFEIGELLKVKASYVHLWTHQRTVEEQLNIYNDAHTKEAVIDLLQSIVSDIDDEFKNRYNYLVRKSFQNDFPINKDYNYNSIFLSEENKYKEFSISPLYKKAVPLSDIKFPDGRDECKNKLTNNFRQLL